MGCWWLLGGGLSFYSKWGAVHWVLPVEPLQGECDVKFVGIAEVESILGEVVEGGLYVILCGDRVEG